jgi:threonine dehydrogenase-like Zn-dependent dehydrogenase
VAVFTEPLSVAEKAVNEAVAVERGRLGESAWSDPPPRVLVTGLGPIAFAAVLACRCRDWPVTVYGRDDEETFRAAAVRGFGAAYLPAARYGFDPRDVEQDGFDLVLECTGSDEVMVRSASSLAACGVMVWLGSARVPKPRELNVSQVMRHAVLRNHIHLGTVNAAPRDFADALVHLAQLNAAAPQQLAAIFTERVAPEDSLWHYENRRPQGIKTIVEFGAKA